MTTLYAAMRGGLVVATDGGDGWTGSVTLADHDLECVAAVPEHPDRVFVGTFESGLLRSTDGGETFERVGASIASDAVMSVAVSPHDHDEVWVGTEPSAVYRSVDGGDSFEHLGGLTDLPSEDEWYFPPRPETHHVRWIEPDPNDPERVYVGIEAGAFVYSHGGGETWHDRPPQSRRDNHTLATHPDAPGRVYAAAGDGYAESTDGGETWEVLEAGLDHTYVWGLAVDPADPDTVIVSAAHGAGDAHRPPGDAHLYRRAGDGWHRIDDRGLPTGAGRLRAVLTAGLSGGAFYGATDTGAFYTDDTGESWTELPVQWPDRFEGTTARGLAVVEPR